MFEETLDLDHSEKPCESFERILERESTNKVYR